MASILTDRQKNSFLSINSYKKNKSFYKEKIYRDNENNILDILQEVPRDNSLDFNENVYTNGDKSLHKKEFVKKLPSKLTSEENKNVNEILEKILSSFKNLISALEVDDNFIKTLKTKIVIQGVKIGIPKRIFLLMVDLCSYYIETGEQSFDIDRLNSEKGKSILKDGILHMLKFMPNEFN